MNPIKTEKENFLLIDDDPLFRALVEAAGAKMGLAIESFGSVAEMGSFARIKQYAGVLLDFELEHLNGLEIAEYIDTFFVDIPVMLVTGHNIEVLESRKRPLCIQKITSKKRPITDILEEMVGCINRQMVLKKFSAH